MLSQQTLNGALFDMLGYKDNKKREAVLLAAQAMKQDPGVFLGECALAYLVGLTELPEVLGAEACARIKKLIK